MLPDERREDNLHRRRDNARMALLLHAVPAPRVGSRPTARRHLLRQHADARAPTDEETDLADARRVPRLRRHPAHADLQPRVSSARPDEEARGLGGHEEDSRAVGGSPTMKKAKDK